MIYLDRIVWLASDANPDAEVREAWQAKILRREAGDFSPLYPAPEPRSVDEAIAIGLANLGPAGPATKSGCCGGGVIAALPSPDPLPDPASPHPGIDPTGH